MHLWPEAYSQEKEQPHALQALHNVIYAGIQIQPLQPFVVCCCTLNNSRLCDEHLFDKLAQTHVVIN